MSETCRRNLIRTGDHDTNKDISAASLSTEGSSSPRYSKARP